jgi:predicted GNAT superfamily acetyltransferase
MVDATVAHAPAVNPSGPGPSWTEPTEGNLTLTDRRLLVEIPAGFSEMQRKAPDLALRWRLTTRRIFQTYFAHGYRVVDFFLAREAGRGQYLLVRPVETTNSGL